MTSYLIPNAMKLYAGIYGAAIMYLLASRTPKATNRQEYSGQLPKVEDNPQVPISLEFNSRGTSNMLKSTLAGTCWRGRDCGRCAVTEQGGAEQTAQRGTIRSSTAPGLLSTAYIVYQCTRPQELHSTCVAKVGSPNKGVNYYSI